MAAIYCDCCGIGGDRATIEVAVLRRDFRALCHPCIARHGRVRRPCLKAKDIITHFVPGLDALHAALDAAIAKEEKP